MIFLLFASPVHCYFLFDFLADFVDFYEQQFFPQMATALIVLAGAFYIAFFGLYTPRISLTPFISSAIYYVCRDIKNEVVAASTGRDPNEGLGARLIKHLRDALRHLAQHPIPLAVLSFVTACLIVLLLEAAQNVLMLVAMFLAYWLFFSVSFDQYREQNPYVFYIGLIATFVIIYYLGGRLYKYALAVLFGFSGSLILLLVVELISNVDMGFSGLIQKLKDAEGIESIFSVQGAVWALVAFIGTCNQIAFVG
jgi:hypothetical protein